MCAGTYGITTSGDALTLKFVTDGSQVNVGSRVYLMAPGSTTNYQMFNALNQEFTFDVDVSQLPCGLNGALYFSAMDSDGGMAKYANNKAGAQYGTGYCDSQCPRDIKFINGMVGPFLIVFSFLNICRLMLRAGHLPPMTLMLVQETWVPAAVKWTSGRPTPWRLPILLTLVLPSARPCAQEPTAQRPTPRKVFAIRLVATSIRSVWETKASTALA